MPTTENMGFEDRLGEVPMSELLTALEQQVTILIADKRRLREALKVAKDYLDYSLGSPAYEGPNPYPIIEAALKE